MPGVYIIRCKPTGELYVGGTKGRLFCYRFANHRIALRKGEGPPLLQVAWDLHGEAAFEFVPLREFPRELVREKEAYALWKLKPALNKKHARCIEAERRGISPATAAARVKQGNDPFTPQKTGPKGPHPVRKRYEGKSLVELAELAGIQGESMRARISKGDTGTRLVRSRYSRSL